MLGAGAFNRLDESSRRERLAEVGGTAGLDRGRLVRLAVVAGNVDDGDGSALECQLAAEGNAGFAVQIDIQNDAARLFEAAMTKQRTRGIKSNRIKAVLSKQPL